MGGNKLKVFKSTPCILCVFHSRAHEDSECFKEVDPFSLVHCSPQLGETASFCEKGLRKSNRINSYI